MNNSSRDLTHITLQLLFIGLLIGGSFWILRPFLLALIWATMIVVATWPLLIGAQSWLGGKRFLAVAVMITASLLILIVPISLAVVTIAGHATDIVAGSRVLASIAMAPPPDWVEAVPVVGPKIAEEWLKIAAGGAAGLATGILPYVDNIVGWFVIQVGGFGRMLLHFLLTLLIAALLYSNGEAAAEGVRRFAWRLGGDRGENVIRLAAQAVRGVALGVIVTAVVQSALAGIGLAIVGVPYAAILSAVMLFLGVAQIGPMPVLVPAVIWFYWDGHAGLGTVLLIWTAVVGTMDNFLRPVLIRRGANLPLLLIFAGVIGGLIAFGIIGLFVGPVVLAVTYTLLVAWIQGDELEPASVPAAAKDKEETGTGGNWKP
jgi:predicted PurR-regulated permease PerM